MFTITIHAENAQQLASITKHLEGMDVPAFLRSEIAAPKKPAPVEAPAAPVAEQPKKEEKPKVAKVTKPKQEKSSLTYEDDVRSATFAVAGIPGKGPNLITGILGEFGVDHANKLKEEQWAEYIEKCNETAGKHKEPANFA